MPQPPWGSALSSSNEPPAAQAGESGLASSSSKTEEGNKRDATGLTTGLSASQLAAFVR